MRTALLIPFSYIDGPEKGREGYIWQSPNEKDLSREYDTRDQALDNRPSGYKHLDDGWNGI